MIGWIIFGVVILGVILYFVFRKPKDTPTVVSGSSKGEDIPVKRPPDGMIDTVR